MPGMQAARNTLEGLVCVATSDTAAVAVEVSPSVLQLQSVELYAAFALLNQSLLYRSTPRQTSQRGAQSSRRCCPESHKQCWPVKVCPALHLMAQALPKVRSEDFRL